MYGTFTSYTVSGPNAHYGGLYVGTLGFAAPFFIFTFNKIMNLFIRLQRATQQT